MRSWRWGTTGTTFALIPVYFARLAVIDDQVAPGELHLLRLMPKAWLTEGRVTRFRDMPTEFGPVTLEVAIQEGGRTLRVQWEPSFRDAPDDVILHVPPVGALARVTINGRPAAWDGRSPAIRLP